jgi:hypothetical protein
MAYQQDEPANVEAPASRGEMRADAEISRSEAAPRTNRATFRDDEPDKDNRTTISNGAAQPNGQAHAEHFAESGGEDLAVSQEAEAELEVEAGPPSPPKPRGSKRGWWQRRAV